MEVSTRNIIKILGLITLFALGLLFIYATRLIWLWLVTALVLALALNPIVSRLQASVPKLRRGGSTGVVFTSFLLVLGVFLYSLIPPLINESQQLVRQIPSYTTNFQHSSFGQFANRYHLISQLQQNQNQIISGVTSASGSFVDVVKTFFASFIAILTICVFTFFMLTEGPAWHKLFIRVTPTKHRRRVELLSESMYTAVAGYMGARLILSVIAGVATWIILELLGIPYAVALATIVALFDIIPLVGAILGAVVVIIVSLFTSITAAVILLVFFVVFQFVEDHVTQPLIMKRAVKLSSLTVIVAALLGASVFGILGALVAIPIAACIQIYLKESYGEKLPA